MADVAAENVAEEATCDEEQKETDPAEKSEEVDDGILDDEDDDDEDDVMIRIGEIRPNMPFAALQKGIGSGASTGQLPAAGKLDIHQVSQLDGKPIYDADIAGMEDKPWRKPGADITDYFNYGFNEETWLKYCEMQRKLRAEFSGDQAAVTEKLLSSIKAPPETRSAQAASGEAQRKQQARARELQALAQTQGLVRITRINLSGEVEQREVDAAQLAAETSAARSSVSTASSGTTSRVPSVSAARDNSQSTVPVLGQTITTSAPTSAAATSTAYTAPPPQLPNMTAANYLGKVVILPSSASLTSAGAPVTKELTPRPLDVPPPGYGAPIPGVTPLMPFMPQQIPAHAPPRAAYAGFVPGAMGYAPPGVPKTDDDEAASYSDTSDIDEGPPSARLPRSAPSNFPPSGNYGASHHSRRPRERSPSPRYRRGDRGADRRPRDDYASRKRERARSPVDSRSKRSRDAKRERD